MKKALLVAVGLVGVLSFVGCSAGYDSTTDLNYPGTGYYNNRYNNGYDNYNGTGYNNGYSTYNGMGTYNGNGAYNRYGTYNGAGAATTPTVDGVNY